MTKIFISYRRQDTGSLSRRLGDVLSGEFGRDSVFIDTDSIRSAQNWQARIGEALKEASVVIVMIGSRWLHAQDEHGRRRIDMDDDWVRNEILHAVECNRSIIPILVGGATALNKRALPECLFPLADIQAYEIKDEFWERGALSPDRDFAKVKASGSNCIEASASSHLRTRCTSWQQPRGMFR